MQAYIGMDIGGTNTRVGIVSGKMEIRDFAIRPSQAVFKDGREMDSLIKTIAEVLDKNKAERTCAISIGLPSVVGRDGRSVVSTPNVGGLDGVDIVSPIEAAFSLPVFLNKDANLLLLYEMWKRDIGRDKTVIGVFLGTGIGNAVWTNGDMLRGKNNAAGELGHIPVWRNPLTCCCGNSGCIESIASGKYLEEIARVNFPGTDIHELFSHAWPALVLEEFIEALSIPIATEINIFDPDYVIVGGGLVHMPGFPRERLAREAGRKLRRPYPADGTELLFSEGKQEAGVVGAAIYAMMQENKEETV